jgi:hypothetical protein
MSLTEQHLEEADRHIAKAQARIVQQVELIASLALDSSQAAQAEQVLVAMQQALFVVQEHRRLILAEIAQERSGLP